MGEKMIPGTGVPVISEAEVSGRVEAILEPDESR